MMTLQEEQNDNQWISVLLRLSAASLFGAAGMNKFQNGLAGLQDVVQYFQTLFQKTWLPMPLVTLQAQIVPFVELVLPIWLILGFRLSLGWFLTTLYMISLAFGMMVAAQYPAAASNYFYVVLCLAGFYFSRFDSFTADVFFKKKS